MHAQRGAILFDKDGTLFASEQLSLEAWRLTTSPIQLSIGEEFFVQFIGESRQRLVPALCALVREAVLCDEAVRRSLAAAGFPIVKGNVSEEYVSNVVAFLCATKDRLLLQLARNDVVPLSPGCAQLFDFLRGLRQAHRWLRCAIVTSDTAKNARTQLQMHSAEDLFDCVIGIEQSKFPKPDPGPLLLACETLGTGHSRSLFVGDSPADVAAGRAARIFTVCVPNRCCVSAEFADQADRRFESIERIQPLIEEFFGLS